MRLKKLSIFLSIPALALSLASCGNSSEKPTKDEAKAGMAKIIKQLPDFKRQLARFSREEPVLVRGGQDL